ncbi:MAG TPA: undecaprenyl-diphosphatase UppP [Kofleriaceae bacterium]|jgi:undecaprenyl-diphosphatase|nr:undecaprenyl-diphosphatase UppP [Kofleriaceae bacterium]
MDLWFAAVMGAVQGITEFLPVSSTAHLRIVPELLGRGDAGAAYTAVLQLGTLAAVVAYFARPLFVDMPRALLFDRRSPDARLALLLILGTIPIAVAGVALRHHITGDFRSLWVIAGALIAVGLLLIAAERIGRGQRGLAAIRAGDALVIGLAQACALVPGVSRSGATIAAALLLGIRRDDGARFSFLLGVPAIAAAGLFEARDAVRELGRDAYPALAVGCAVAAVTGYASIAWLLGYLQRRGLAPFGVYRILLGALLLALLAAGTLQALPAS